MLTATQVSRRGLWSRTENGSSSLLGRRVQRSKKLGSSTIYRAPRKLETSSLLGSLAFPMRCAFSSTIKL